MSKRLFLLLACLFVVMIGFGITLPVLPFYAERLHIAGKTDRQTMALGAMRKCEIGVELSITSLNCQ